MPTHYPLRPRTWLGVLAALALAAGSAGCGDATTTKEADAAPARTITDATGTKVELPAAPNRVVALSEQDLDASLALGVKPVGTVNGRGQQAPPAYLGDKVAGIAIVGSVAKPTVDKVVEAAPDVILAGGVADPQILDQLRKVAPTVVTYKPDEDWKAAFKRQGEALGKDDKVTEVLAAYDTRVNEVKGRLGANATAEVSIVRWNPQGPGVMQTGQFASLVVSDLGLKRPAAQQEAGFSHGAPVSLENLARIDGEWLFLGTLNPQGAAALEKVRTSPAFQQLNAVKANRLVATDGSLWTSRGGPLAAIGVLADVEKALGAK